MATPVSKYGGIPVDDTPKSKYGGVAVADETPAQPATPSNADLDEFMKQRYSGPNTARNARQRNLDKGLTPQQIWDRAQAGRSAIESYPGFTQTVQGVQQLGTPGQRKAGIYNTVTGAGKFAAPAVLPVAAVTAPAATAYALGAGTAAAPVGEKVAEMSGADPDTAKLVGLGSSIVAGGLAGGPGKVGAMTRGGIQGAARNLPIVGTAPNPENVPFVGRILKGAWEGARQAKDAWEAANPKTAPKPAPTATVAPTAPPAAAPTQAPLPPSRQLGPGPRVHQMPAAEDTSGVIKGYQPTILENQNLPKSPPKSPVTDVVTSDELDAAARAVPGAAESGIKTFAALPENLKGFARAIALKTKGLPPETAAQPTRTNAKSPVPAPSSGPKPAPSVQDAAANPDQTSAGITANSGSPVTPTTSTSSAAPEITAETSAQTTPARTTANSGATDIAKSEADLPRVAAADLVKQGFTPEHLQAMSPAQRAQELGPDAHRFPEIIQQMRDQSGEGFDYESRARAMRSQGATRASVVADRDSLTKELGTVDKYHRLQHEVAQQEKDNAILDYLATEHNITKPEQIKALSDSDLESHVNNTPRPEGGKYRAKSGTGSRPMSGAPGSQKEDLLKELALRNAAPGPGTPSAPISYLDSQNPEIAKTLVEGARRLEKDGSVQVLQRIPKEDISPDFRVNSEGKKIYNTVYEAPEFPDDPTSPFFKNNVQYYMKNPSPLKPSVVPKEGAPGKYKVFEGHHRLEATTRNGDDKPLVWVPEGK